MLCFKQNEINKNKRETNVWNKERKSWRSRVCLWGEKKKTEKKNSFWMRKNVSILPWAQYERKKRALQLSQLSSMEKRNIKKKMVLVQRVEQLTDIAIAFERKSRCLTTLQKRVLRIAMHKYGGKTHTFILLYNHIQTHTHSTKSQMTGSGLTNFH